MIKVTLSCSAAEKITATKGQRTYVNYRNSPVLKSYDPGRLILVVVTGKRRIAISQHISLHLDIRGCKLKKRQKINKNKYKFYINSAKLENFKSPSQPIPKQSYFTQFKKFKNSKLNILIFVYIHFVYISFEMILRGPKGKKIFGQNLSMTHNLKKIEV